MVDTIINLTRGVPPPEVLPVEDMIRCSEAAMKRDGEKLLQYIPSPGYMPLVETFALRYNVKPSQVIIGNSSLEIFAFFTQLLLKPGVRAFVESPSYDRANTLLKRSGGEVVGIPMEEDGMDLSVFEAELKRGSPSLLYIISDFQNPMGVTTSEAKRRQIADWARKWNFWIVEDAPYRMLRYKGQEVPSLWSMAPERVVHIGSLSKLVAPGLRLGYAVGSEEMIGRMVRWAVDTYIGPVAPTHGMVYEYFHQELFEANVEKLKKIYAPRLEALAAAANRFIPKATYPKPEGGFFISLTLPEGNKMDNLLGRAPEIGLKLTDGRGFFLNPADGERFLRIPFCTVTPEEIEEAMRRLSSIMVQ